MNGTSTTEENPYLGWLDDQMKNAHIRYKVSEGGSEESWYALGRYRAYRDAKERYIKLGDEQAD